jgi:hypothetical protein
MNIQIEHTRRSPQIRQERIPEPLTAGEDDDSAPENDTSAGQDFVDSVISYLNVAKDPVIVMTEHSNDKARRENRESVKAYAKIAGRDWTYYVQSRHVNIGRPPDRDQRLDSQSSPVAVAAQALPEVHIDLGPSKFVSRLHAEIFYDGEDLACWRIRVNGRNGVRLNNAILKRGADSQISCGDVIEIAGTQMMFVTPGDRAVIHPGFVERAQHMAATEEPAIWDGSQHAHPEASQSRRRMSLMSNNRYPTGVQGGTEPAPATVTPSFKRQTTPTARPRSPNTADVPTAKPSPLYNRGMMMESTEEIDYSKDSAKDLKPPYSYANMIAQAIFSSEEEKLTLNSIYTWIMEKYAFYRHSQSGWQVRYLTPVSHIRAALGSHIFLS